MVSFAEAGEAPGRCMSRVVLQMAQQLLLKAIQQALLL